MDINAIVQAVNDAEGTVTARVWWCGDEYCNCTQAEILDVTPHPHIKGMVRNKQLWSGDFNSDVDWNATLELCRLAARLRRHHPEVCAKIKWVDRDAEKIAART